MERGQRLVEDTKRQLARDALGTLLGSDEGRTHTVGDAGRLEEFVLDAMTAAVAAQGRTLPVASWQKTVAVLQDAANTALRDWSRRRNFLLTHLVNPGIARALHGHGANWPWVGGWKTPFPDPMREDLQRDMLEALDRPPVRSFPALQATADAMAWSAVRDFASSCRLRR